MRHQHARTLSDDDLLKELRNVAERLGTRTVTMDEFNRASVRAKSLKGIDGFLLSSLKPGLPAASRAGSYRYRGQ